jgi:hypothetical protein
LAIPIESYSCHPLHHHRPSKDILSIKALKRDESRRKPSMSSTSNSTIAGEEQPLLPTTTTSSIENDTNVDDDKHPTILHDAYDTVVLGIPIFCSTLTWVGMKTTDSALLGHVSAEALAAAALSDLVRMITLIAYHRYCSIHVHQHSVRSPLPIIS